jgi:hypothetical protein
MAATDDVRQSPGLDRWGIVVRFGLGRFVAGDRRIEVLGRGSLQELAAVAACCNSHLMPFWRS